MKPHIGEAYRYQEESTGRQFLYLATFEQSLELVLSLFQKTCSQTVISAEEFTEIAPSKFFVVYPNENGENGVEDFEQAVGPLNVLARMEIQDLGEMSDSESTANTPFYAFFLEKAVVPRKLLLSYPHLKFDHDKEWDDYELYGTFRAVGCDVHSNASEFQNNTLRDIFENWKAHQVVDTFF